MILTSATYSPYPDLRFVNFDLTFDVVAVDAAMLAAPSSSEQYEASQIQQSHDQTEEITDKYATLEHNLFRLDGTTPLYPKKISEIQTGWISKGVSDDTGEYSDTPTLSFSFSEPQTSYGITVAFDDRQSYAYPSKMNVAFYDAAGIVLQEQTVFPIDNNMIWVAAQVENYSKITIKFEKTTLPRRRIRVSEVFFGAVVKYDRKNLVNLTDKQEIDPLAESLPSAELAVTIDNSTKMYNMLNPTGLYKYLQDGQYVRYRAQIGTEKINRGRRYFYNAESDDDGLTATIVFNDPLIFLDDITYNGGMYGTWTLSDAVESIMKTAEFEVETVFDSDVDATIIRKCIPQETTCREALRYCAQAAMCVCYFDHNNRLHFSPLTFAKDAEEQLTRDILRSEPTIQIGDRYNTVQLVRQNEYSTLDTSRQYYTKTVAKNDEMILTKEIINPLVNDTDAFLDWALTWAQRRTKFKIDSRGNPALETGDIVQVFDQFNVNGNALITSITLQYDGGLSAEMEAMRP